jgi:hypothetical protein
MKYCQITKYSYLAALLSFGISSLALGYCTHHPNGLPGDPIEFCMKNERYVFTILGQTQEYGRRSYKLDMTEAIAGWLEAIGTERRGVRVRVDYWFSIPEINPAATKVRLVVSFEDRKFVIAAAIEPDLWNFTNREVAILDGNDYPQDFGVRAGSLITDIKEQTSASEFYQLVDVHGAVPSASCSDLFEEGREKYCVVHVPVFSERRVFESFHDDPKTYEYLNGVEFNQVFEWLAYYSRAFSFHFYL